MWHSSRYCQAHTEVTLQSPRLLPGGSDESNIWQTKRLSLLCRDSPGQKNLNSFSSFCIKCAGDHYQIKTVAVSQHLKKNDIIVSFYIIFFILLYYLLFIFYCLDTLSKEEFHLKQNVEPFIHYKEKHATFECITRENIEAVAAKVIYYWLMCTHLQKKCPW